MTLITNRETGAFWLTQYALREPTFGAGLSPLTLLNKWHEIVSTPLANFSGEEYTDAEENTGHTGPSENGAATINLETGFDLEMKQEIELFGLLCGSLNGNIQASGGPTDYSHLSVNPGGNILGPLSFPVIIGTDRFDPTSIFEYRGMVCTRLQLETDGKGPLKLTGTIRGDGSEVAAAGVTPPAVGTAIFGKRLYGPQQQLLFGPLGTEDVTAAIRSITITMTAEVEEGIDHTRAPKVGCWLYTRNAPDITATLQLAGKKGGTFYNYLKNRDILIFDYTAAISATQSIRIKGDAVQCELAGGGQNVEFRNRIEQVVNLPIRFHNKAGGSNRYDITIKNQVPAYLAAA